MKNINLKLASKINDLDKPYNIQSLTKIVIMIVPIVIIVLYINLLAVPSTRSIGLLMLKENQPIELMTAAVFAVGGWIGFKLTRDVRRYGEENLVYYFYLIFSMGLIFIAMEEIAWGQWLLGFETPKAWKAINLQGETTIHNIYGLSGHSELLRLAFGVGGFVGLWRSAHPSFQKIGAPGVLSSWFMIVGVHASLDIFNDYIPIQEQIDDFIGRTPELIELLIAISAYLYLRLNSRIFGVQNKE